MARTQAKQRAGFLGMSLEFMRKFIPVNLHAAGYFHLDPHHMEKPHEFRIGVGVALSSRQRSLTYHVKMFCLKN